MHPGAVFSDQNSDTTPGSGSQSPWKRYGGADAMLETLGPRVTNGPVECRPPPFQGLNIRIPIMIPMQGRGFINQGSTSLVFIGLRVWDAMLTNIEDDYILLLGMGS